MSGEELMMLHQWPREFKKTSVTKYRFGLFVTRGIWKRLASVLPSKSHSLNLNSRRLLTTPPPLPPLLSSCGTGSVSPRAACYCSKRLPLHKNTVCHHMRVANVFFFFGLFFATSAPRHPSPVTLLSKNIHPCPRKRANSCY